MTGEVRLTPLYYNAYVLPADIGPGEVRTIQGVSGLIYIYINIVKTAVAAAVYRFGDRDEIFWISVEIPLRLLPVFTGASDVILLLL